jgi:glycosyltransferase involved in cell wall biosynthesis
MRGRDIVCVSSLDWDAHWTSKQQIMHRLSAANRILYVEEPVTMLAPLKVPARWRRWSALRPSIEKRSPGLWTLTPPPLLPFGNMIPLVNRVNQAVLAAYIRTAVGRLGFSEYLLWSYLPTAVHLLGRLSPAAVLYHCVDEHSAFPGFVRPEVVKSYDDVLTARADLVVTTARNLRDSRLPLNPNTHHVPNAADVEHFKRALDPGLPEPADLAALPHPRIGVVGVHDERLDLEAIEALSRAEPGWRIVLIGPIQPGDVDEDRLRRLENVKLLGSKPVAELPAYLKGLDVALIPYRLNELSRNIFPLKLFEYLAAGLPVVASALPELEPYADTVGLASGAEEFPALVREALGGDGPYKRAARVRLAEVNTWEDRVEAISALVEETLGGGATKVGSR